MNNEGIFRIERCKVCGSRARVYWTGKLPANSLCDKGHGKMYYSRKFYYSLYWNGREMVRACSPSVEITKQQRIDEEAKLYLRKAFPDRIRETSWPGMCKMFFEYLDDQVHNQVIERVTAKGYKSCVNMVNRRAPDPFDGKLVHQIKTVDIKGVLDSAGIASGTTYNHVLTIIKKMFAAAAAGELKAPTKDGKKECVKLLVSSPFTEGKVKTKHTETARDRVLEDSEEPVLAAECLKAKRPEMCHMIYQIGLRTGLRQGDVFTLRLEHIQLNWNGGEGRIYKMMNKLKRYQRHVSVPLDDDFRAMLIDYLKWWQVQPFQKHNKKQWLFPSSSIPDHPLAPGVDFGFEDAVARAKLPDFVFKDLRATFCVRLLEEGVHIEDVAELLGHGENISTTLKHYARLAKQRAAKGMRERKRRTPLTVVIDTDTVLH
jgi:integrase